MNRLAWLSAFAVGGVAVAAFVVYQGHRPAEPSSAPVTAASTPFQSFVAGSGLTENGRGNVAIATAIPGVVREVYVRAGDSVRAGDRLFKVDDRDVQASLAVATAMIGQAEVAASKQQHRLDYLNRLAKVDHGAISADALTTARDDAAASVSAVAVAKADAARLRVELDRLLVRAPVAARVLQVNVRPGEYASDSAATQPPMLLGDDTRMFLRVDVDETDAWRVRPAARAVAYARGAPRNPIPLHFEYVEPYVTPKRSLTGQATERTDVRVLQVVYSFERGTLPVYLGQQMDAFIEAEPAPGSGGPR